MRRLATGFNRVLQFLFLQTIILCSVFSLLFVNNESTIVLFIFDFLFISLAFQLIRTLSLKFGLLALGNLFGLFCNFIFNLLNIVGVKYLGEIFLVVYTISFPILNVSWIVTFWSLSLAALHNPINVTRNQP